jgi:GTP-binding protein
MKIRSAEFVKSAVEPGHYPGGGFPEIAFLGRSNAGKSSLINTLLNRKHLVKTSRTPGKTRHLNFFFINDTLMFVDLPGYGYAKVPHTLKKNWKHWIETYLQQRDPLKAAVLVMDIRRLPGEEELSLVKWLARRKRKTLVVLTKADKLSRARQMHHHTAAFQAFGEKPDALILFSAKTGQGKEGLWKAIEACL